MNDQPGFTILGSYGLPTRFFAPNKRVAVTPFPPTAKNEVKGGVIRPMNSAALTPLIVVFQSGLYMAGQVVYVRAKLQTGSIYGKEIFEVDGTNFILIPEDEILLVDSLPGAK